MCNCNFLVAIRHTNNCRWWRIRGSNPWPPACKAGALPAELIPHMLVFCPLHCVAARSFVGYIPKYAPSALPRAPCESSKILRNLHCRILFKTNSFQIPTLALCVGFLYYCFTRSENFLVSRFNLKLYPLAAFPLGKTCLVNAFAFSRFHFVVNLCFYTCFLFRFQGSYAFVQCRIFA